MGASKITPEQRAALRGLYMAGKGAQAQKLARELGVSAYYPTVLAHREINLRPPQTNPSRPKAAKWARAVAKGPVLASAAILALLAADARAATFQDLWGARIKPPPYAGLATEFDDRLGADGRELHPYQNRYCAHRTEAFGQMLRVTNIENGKSTVCEVRDRGPSRKFWPRREIDLTPPASKDIDCQGMCRVTIEREIAP